MGPRSLPPAVWSGLGGGLCVGSGVVCIFSHADWGGFQAGSLFPCRRFGAAGHALQVCDVTAHARSQNKKPSLQH